MQWSLGIHCAVWTNWVFFGLNAVTMSGLPRASRTGQTGLLPIFSTIRTLFVIFEVPAQSSPHSVTISSKPQTTSLQILAVAFASYNFARWVNDGRFDYELQDNSAVITYTLTYVLAVAYVIWSCVAIHVVISTRAFLLSALITPNNFVIPISFPVPPL